MPRPKLIRRMNNPPHFKGFSPMGLSDKINPVVLNYEEYEAIRLSDFEFHGQVEAAKIMQISRPTYARIYESARRKVAQAFVLGKPIVFEGGKVYFDSEWFSCNSCGCWFNHPAKEEEITNCTLCGSKNIEQYHENSESDSETNVCICPKCNYEMPHSSGIQCSATNCPQCNTKMMRKGAPFQNRHQNRNCK